MSAMDLTRLRRVRDICPLSGARFRWLYATRWMAAVAASAAPIEFFDNGYTVTVVKNRLLEWRRTFSVGGDAPPSAPPSRALISLHEWCPSVWPPAGARRGWRRLGIQHREAIVFLDEIDHANFTASWSSQARRHLAAFKKARGVTLRLGTFDEVKKNIVHSQIPMRLHEVFLDCVEKHLTTHPETIEIMVAEAADGILLGCFVAGYIHEIKQSYYLTGFFRRGHEHTQVMTGLIDWWFERAFERGCETLNFGHITGPRPLPGMETGVGYSIFKTHFGARRVWWPGSFWKVIFR